MKRLPKARNTGVVIQSLDNEVLIYDLNINKAHSLNEVAAVVYKACDGETSFDELRKDKNLTDDVIFFALDEMKKENLLESGEEYSSPFKGLSRRQVMKKIGVSSMLAIPIISSLVAPTSISAASGAAPPPGCFPSNTFIALFPLPPATCNNNPATPNAACCSGTQFTMINAGNCEIRCQ